MKMCDCFWKEILIIKSFFFLSDPPSRCEKFRQSVHHHCSQFNASRQDCPNEPRPRRFLCLLLSQPRICCLCLNLKILPVITRRSEDVIGECRSRLDTNTKTRSSTLKDWRNNSERTNYWEMTSFSFRLYCLCVLIIYDIRTLGF